MHRTLPVHLHISPATPSVALSFPSPHTPPHEAFPVSVTFRLEGGRLRASVDVTDSPEGEEVQAKLDVVGLEKVARATADLGLVMEWIGRRLGC